MRGIHTNEITRYLDGAMNAAERASFESRLAGDELLRRHVDAERAIRLTIDRDLSAMPVEHAATRARMLSALESLPPTPPGGLAPAASTGASAGSGVSPLLRWLGAAGGGAAVIVAGALLLSRPDRAAVETPSRTPSAAPVESTAAPAATTATPSLAAPDAASTTEAQSADARATDAPAAGTATEAPSAAPRTSETTPRIVERRDGTAPDPTPETPRATTETPTTTDEPAVAPRRRELRVIDRDSVKVRVGVDVEVRREP